MRGNSIVWMALIAVIVSSLLANAGMNLVLAAPKAKIYLDPSRLPEEPGTLGHPGDNYTLAVKIDNVVNAWSVQFTVKYNPYGSVLVASDFQEGDFLSEGGTWPTAFYASPNIFEGTVTFAIFRLGPYGSPGASGSGTLATLKLDVIECGESPLDIINSILLAPPSGPGDVVYIPHETAGGYYYGPYARLLRVNLPDGRKVKAGDNFTISTKVKNEGDVPMNVTVRCWIQRAEDGRAIGIRAGQTYMGGGIGEPRPFQYLYLNEYSEWWELWWVNPGASLFGPPDGNFAISCIDGAWTSLYGFDDINLAGKEVAEITCEVYSQYPNGATEAVDIDLYGFSSVSSFAWLGSGWGTTSWDWHGMRWTSDSVLTVMPELANETELNNMELLIVNYHGDFPDRIRLDSVRLKVEFASIVPIVYQTWELQAGEERELPSIVWQSTEDHIGSYTLAANVEYSCQFLRWNNWGSREKDLVFWIVDP